jgi:hypothetical protein
MRKALTYSSFAITSLLVILAFITATTYTQLGIAVVLYPFLAFFAYKLFIVKTQKLPAVSYQPPAVKSEEKTEAKSDNVSVADFDKRAFLKLIGATGISFFLFSLLNRRVGNQLFGGSDLPGISTLTDVSGNKIDPSERQLLDGYIISEIDEGYVAYYGFITTLREKQTFPATGLIVRISTTITFTIFLSKSANSSFIKYGF